MDTCGVSRILRCMTTSAGTTPPAPWVPDTSTFGARLALVRQKMGWGNVKVAAQQCGVPVESWRNWERDGMEPRRLVTIAMAIATRTGVDVDWLVYGPNGKTIQVGGQVSSNYLSDPLAPRIVAPIGRKPEVSVVHGDDRRRRSGRSQDGRPADNRSTSTAARRAVSLAVLA